MKDLLGLFLVCWLVLGWLVLVWVVAHEQATTVERAVWSDKVSRWERPQMTEAGR